ncbi:MAG: DUF6630 family protein [Janthinobacterium lividum]
MSSLTDFVQLFSLADAAATQRIEARLALVLRDPAAYQAQYADELAERGIETALPAQELRDVALIDALLSEDLLWESDPQDPLADTAEGLSDILVQQGRPERVRVASTRGASGPEQLDALQDALELLGLALVLLTLDSDLYPLSLVADEQAEEARQLAQELGFELAVY